MTDRIFKYENEYGIYFIHPEQFTKELDEPCIVLPLSESPFIKEFGIWDFLRFETEENLKKLEDACGNHSLFLWKGSLHLQCGELLESSTSEWIPIEKEVIKFVEDTFRIKE